MLLISAVQLAEDA